MGLFRRRRKLPIIGVKNAGKTYFLVSLGYLVSEYRWGEPTADTATYFYDCLREVIAGRPIPATAPGMREIEITLNKVLAGDKEIKTNLLLTTKEFSGAEYERAMEMLTRVEEESFTSAPELKKFYEMFSGSHGCIVIIDLVRDAKITPDEFKKHRDEYIRKAFAEQISPLAKGVELFLRGRRIWSAPLFFVFTKSDVHNLSREEIRRYLNKIMAMSLARLEQKNVWIRIHSVSSVGWGGQKSKNAVLNRLESFGFKRLLLEIGVLGALW